jgi:hypothetical protein
MVDAGNVVVESTLGVTAEAEEVGAAVSAAVVTVLSTAMRIAGAAFGRLPVGDDTGAGPGTGVGAGVRASGAASWVTGARKGEPEFSMGV